MEVSQAPIALLSERKKPRPIASGGVCRELSSIAVLARARPEQRIAFAAFIVEKVRIDRRIERGIVELEREIIAALLGALRPGGSNFSLMRRAA